MAIKHALIVDDSKSARAVLRRMLEEFNLKVDSVESADEALRFLKKTQPDVIFMDHMMPGMDGFEAVKHIKNNPQTSVIPIMMYTSRGGEVYLSRARALGAIGIISKTISPVGLKESLFKLGLLDDRRHEERRNPAEVAGIPLVKSTHDEIIEAKSTDEKKDYAAYLTDLNRLMDDQTIELHKSMWLSVESVSNEIFNRLHTELDEKFEKLKSEGSANNKYSWSLYVLSVLFLLSIVINVLLLTVTDHSENNFVASNQIQPVFSEDDVDAGTETNTNIDILPADNQRARDEFIQWAQNKTIEYPFDELALNDNRQPEIDELLQKAVDAGFSGDILLQTHVGMFCLTRDQDGNFKLTDDNLPVIDCEYIGNHVQPTDLPSTHQSLSFANYLSDSLLNGNGIAIDVTNLPRTTEISKYPKRIAQTTVKEWNLAAQGNNRITVKLIPAPADAL
ncbi:MAG: response regulator [Gammaproteobacteria bacterium]|nr:response regulator [Gammaproteobacteria bacterium]